MAAKKMLFETLMDLSFEELDEFKSVIQLEEGFPRSSKSRLKVANRQDIAELMVEVYGERCVELTNKVLKKMNRTDLVQRLSGTKEKQWPSLIQTVKTMAAKKMLFETLTDLSSEELDEFKSLIQLKEGFPRSSKSRLKVANTQDIAELMVEVYGRRCVELTNKVLKKMNRTDLVQRLSGTKEKQWPSLSQRVSMSHQSDRHTVQLLFRS
ncbi:uncharacterized protein [Enoplosus armatus]|uniref:uncharacterized protein n=1 Tax=Enoplosus armatus TaxID=215367 RepID=UPI0039962104